MRLEPIGTGNSINPYTLKVRYSKDEFSAFDALLLYLENEKGLVYDQQDLEAIPHSEGTLYIQGSTPDSQILLEAKVRKEQDIELLFRIANTKTLEELFQKVPELKNKTTL